MLLLISLPNGYNGSSSQIEFDCFDMVIVQSCFFLGFFTVILGKCCSVGHLVDFFLSLSTMVSISELPEKEMNLIKQCVHVIH